MNNADEPAVAGVDPAPAARDALLAAQALLAVLRDEAGFLQERRRDGYAALLARKQELAMAYHQALRTLSAEPRRLAQLDGGLRQQLRTVATELDTAAAENSLLLRKASAIAGGVLQAIVREVRRHQQQEQVHYTQSGLAERVRPSLIRQQV